MSEYIPFEIQIEIIKRLPVKSSLQFRLVSKPWNSYIGSSEFIISHHHHHHHHQPPRLLACCKDPATDVTKYVTVIDDHTFYQQDFTPNPPLVANLLWNFKVIDSSLCLLCFHGYLYKFVSEMAILWNPLIRKSMEVLLPYSSSNKKIAGFGVCPVTFDPTIVKISHGDLIHCLPWEVDVFTLNSGTWKPLMSTHLPRKTVYIYIYWDACERRIVAEGARPRNVNLIVSFDMTTREFQVMDLPDSLSRPFDMTLSKIRESVVVVEYIRDDVKDVCAVWVMEDMVTKSFTKMYTIKAPNTSMQRVLGFRKSGEAIMETRYNGEKNAMIGVYEPCSEHISKLGIYGEDGSFFVSSYMETLLLLDRADCDINADTY